MGVIVFVSTVLIYVVVMHEAAPDLEEELDTLLAQDVIVDT